jgi:hypothetical protein
MKNALMGRACYRYQAIEVAYTMNHYIAASDTGNGNTNAILVNDGNSKSICIPSIRARVSSQTLDLGKASELTYTWAEWGGQRYAVGDDALLVNRQGIDRHMGAARYASEHHQFLTAYALARLGVKDSSTVDLTLMCPPALYNDNRQVMIDTYKSSPVEIMLKGDKKPRRWAYSEVTVWPEGFPAAACFMLAADGSKAASPVMAGDVVLLDTGAYTANAFILSNGKFNPAGLVHSTIENGGGDAHIRTPLLESIRLQGGELAAVTTDDLDKVLRLASASGDYVLRFGRAEVDLLPTLKGLAEDYAGWLSNNVIDSRFNGLRGISRLLVIGGNADYVTDHLKNWYGEKVVTAAEWRGAVGRLHAADLNAEGAKRLALARQTRKG